jgi:hypothetical protein
MAIADELMLLAFDRYYKAKLLLVALGQWIGSLRNPEH